MTTLLKFSINLPVFTTSLWHSHFCRKPIPCCSLPRTKFASFHQSSYKLRALGEERCWCYLGVGKGKDGILMKEEGLKRKKRMVLVRFNQGFGFGSGGGGGGGGDNNANARILGNLALAILLTYLSMTGQLGWVLDAIVSIWVCPAFPFNLQFHVYLYICLLVYLYMFVFVCRCKISSHCRAYVVSA